MFQKYGGIIEQVATTATATGTTTLLNTSKQIQVFTGTTTQTVVLPDATIMSVGQKFEIINQSTGLLTLQFNGGAAFTDASGTNYSNINHNTSMFVILQTNGTSAGTWAVLSSTTGAISSPGPTVQKFTSGTSQTYTTPANVAYIRVRMVGGGGGGGGGGTTNGTAATAGTASTFGTSLLSAGGGGLGVAGQTNGAPGAGGTSSLGTGPIGTALTGSTGTGGGSYSTGTGVFSGVPGGNSVFGGGGAGNYQSAGSAATTNSGSGGGSGGATDNASASQVGGSGGSGGYVEAIIVGPAATYTYTVGSGGNAGGAGSNGFSGGAGAAGYIEVTEYYFNGMGALAGNGGAYQPTVQRLTSDTSQTYTTPANVAYIVVEVIGGGGGGAGAGTSAVTGTTGNATTFDGTNLNAGGGTAGLGQGGSGGTAAVSGSWIQLAAIPGNSGQGGDNNSGTSALFCVGGTGGAGFFGGAGKGGSDNGGSAASTNSGAGGGGAGSASTAGHVAGAGGGAGGYVKALIVNPAATYTYSIGASASGGTGSDFNGGAGGSGYIVVTEYYNNGAVGTATNVTGVVAVANGGTGVTSIPSARVSGTTGQTITTGSTATVIYNTKAFDTATAFNTSTGVYTVPVAGKYLVSGSVVSLSTGTTGAALILNHGASQVSSGPYAVAVNGAISMTAPGDIINCAVNDTIFYSVYNANSGSLVLNTSTTAGNYIAIVWVGP
jgi:hypothetical protein